MENLKKQRSGAKKRKKEFKQTFDQLLESYQTITNKAVTETKLEELAKHLPDNG
ncbi:hypothetical protein [Lentibacillus sp. Marseille-P4043]|uniref:hypothetical protein n=1 Tax=Lentibacillus sp. Marseille-P4043 TaxID=2040293 RepID=UPI00131A4A40|nr:hypothetical protein [Lentibacillus sp. Marseille-P4043]